MNHIWWRQWVCTCRLNRNQLAIFYNPSIVLRLEGGLAACFICCSKAFSLSGNNFSTVDLLILFKNVFSLSVSISQPSKLSLLLKCEFTRSCCAWSHTSIVISMGAPSSAKSSGVVISFSQLYMPVKNG